MKPSSYTTGTWHESRLLKPWNTVMCMLSGQVVFFVSMKAGWVAPACQQCVSSLGVP